MIMKTRGKSNFRSRTEGKAKKAQGNTSEVNLTLESMEHIEDPILCITSMAEQTAAFTLSVSACRFCRFYY